MWSPRTATCSTTRSGRTCATPRPDATDGELWDAIDSARLGDLVRSLPDGLETVVGERGYRLSGGERQRLTIARLLLAKPRVVILDEATAHLDSQSEVAVQEALVAALEGRTALVIAHRLSTIRAADAILVIDEGRVSSAAHTPSCSPPAADTPSSTALNSRTVSPPLSVFERGPGRSTHCTQAL